MTLLRARSAKAERGFALPRQRRLWRDENQALEASEPPAGASLDRDLRSHFDHTAGRNLEIIGRVIGGAAQRDEQMILPARHPGMPRRLQRPPRQEERG